jgi:formate-dependent nitrite reductase membrane component NrfD
LISGLFALLVMGYPGLVLCKNKGMPLWGIPFLPLLFISAGLLGGLGVSVIFSLFTLDRNLILIETSSQWTLMITAILLLAYLFVISKNKIKDSKSEAYRSNKRIFRITLTLALILGIVFPLLMTLKNSFTSIPDYPVIIAVIAGELLSGVVFGYYLLKSGIYSPLFTGLNPAPDQKSSLIEKHPVIEKWLLRGG